MGFHKIRTSAKGDGINFGIKLLPFEANRANRQNLRLLKTSELGIKVDNCLRFHQLAPWLSGCKSSAALSPARCKVSGKNWPYRFVIAVLL